MTRARQASSDRSRLGKGIPPALAPLKLAASGEGDFTIVTDYVAQPRDKPIGVYNVVGAVSIFDRQQNLLCRNLYVATPEDLYGHFSPSRTEAPADWETKSRLLWRQCVEAFGTGDAARFARGLGNRRGMGTTRLGHKPETLAGLSARVLGPDELHSPLTDLSRKLAAEQQEAQLQQALLASDGPPLARPSDKSWQVHADPPPTAEPWQPQAGWEVTARTVRPDCVAPPHGQTPFVAVKDQSVVRCYDLRSGDITGYLVLFKSWEAVALDAHGTRLAVLMQTQNSRSLGLDVYAFEPTPPPTEDASALRPFTSQPNTVLTGLSPRGWISQLSFTPREEIVAVIGLAAHVVDAVTGRVRHQLDLDVRNTQRVPTAVSPGGCYLAHLHSQTGYLRSGKLQVRLLDLRSGIVAGTLPLPEQQPGSGNPVGSHPGALRFSDDGQHLALLFGPYLTAWDLATQQVVCQVDLTESFAQVAQRDRRAILLRQQLGLLHWLPEQSAWLALGSLIIQQQSGAVQTAIIGSRVADPATIFDFPARVMPGPTLLQPWSAGSGSDAACGVTLTDINAQR